MKKQRPVYLDVLTLAANLPIPGIVSILHRISGVALFIGLPLFLWLFSGTLNREENYQIYASLVSHPLIKLILIGFLWAYLHHLFAGIRFLFLDAHRGLELHTARKTAQIVAISAAVATILIGAYLW